MKGLTKKQALRMVGDGWSVLVADAFANLRNEAYITDIKEKYGTLRINLIGADDELYDKIEALEEQSSHICEVCGGSGETRTDRGWLKTLCDCCNKLDQ
jgi:hypothetical protein